MSATVAPLSSAYSVRVRLAAAQERDRQECRASPHAFVERHVTIEEPTGDVLPFRLWPAQRDALTSIHERDAVVVLKARRLGLSWLAIAYAVWLAIHRPGVRVLMLCKSLDDASMMVGRARRIVDRILADPASAHVLDGWQLSRDATMHVELKAPDGRSSTFRALPAKARAARSETAGLVILDELAFVDDADEVIAAVQPTTEGGGKLVALSTGNGTEGQGGPYARLYGRAADGSSGAEPIFLPYTARPGRDPAWRERAIAAMGDRERGCREYPETEAEALAAAGVTYAYGPAAIAAAVRLGRELDDALARDDELGLELRAALAAEPLLVGLDWGESTHALLAVPLEGGGLYVLDEVVGSSLEPGEASRRVLEAAERIVARLGSTGGIAEARYDAAGIQSMRTFAATVRRHELGRDVRTTRVPFGKFKAEAFGYARRLVGRAALGQTTRVLAVSPRCAELIRQAAALRVDPDTGAIAKGDDHGPDALLAVLAPIAVRHRAALEAEAERAEPAA